MATAYRHRGSDLPLTPPDPGPTTVECHICGETFVDDSDDLSSEAICRAVAYLLGERPDAVFCCDCVGAELTAHPRGALVRANLA